MWSRKRVIATVSCGSPSELRRRSGGSTTQRPFGPKQGRVDKAWASVRTKGTHYAGEGRADRQPEQWARSQNMGQVFHCQKPAMVRVDEPKESGLGEP